MLIKAHLSRSEEPWTTKNHVQWMSQIKTTNSNNSNNNNDNNNDNNNNINNIK